MITPERLEDLNNKIFSSPFNLKNYEISLSLFEFQSKIMYWGESFGNKRKWNDEDASNTKEVLDRMVPIFQRENNKWSREMQISFVENVILGTSSTIMLAYTTNGEKERVGIKRDCVLLDGLQRFTAISAWLDGEFPVFGDIYSSKELIDKIEHNIDGLKLRIYMFQDEKEMVEFYIKMNENITHSSEDIKKAKEYLKLLIKKEIKKTDNFKKMNR
jgi:cyclophilin family peptidyl-prolyl cis-trans isomerase